MSNADELDAALAVCDQIQAGRYSPHGLSPKQLDALIAAARAHRSAVPREPTKAMFAAARDWSAVFVGSPIGNRAATGCWQAMWDAALSTPKESPNV